MKKKTVLHLTGMKSIKYGGFESYLVELVRLCDKKGYNTVIQYDLFPNSSDYLFHLKKFGAKVVTLNSHGNLLRSIISLAFLIYSTKADVVLTHFVSYKIRFAIPIITRLLGVQKTIAMVHSVQVMRKKSKKRVVFNKYKNILTVSKALGNDLIQGGVNPRIISTLYLGLFTPREHSTRSRSKLRKDFGIPDKAVVLTCIAFDDPVKGIDILLSAFKKVVDNFNFAHLIVVGVDPLTSELYNEGKRMGIDNYVHWPGIVNNTWEILNASDIYVQSSRSEGLPFAILEAMSLKLPVVATRVGGVPEAVIDRETGYLADFADPVYLASAIIRMLAEQKRWNKFGEAGFNLYRRMFRGEHSIKTLVENYFEP